MKEEVNLEIKKLNYWLDLVFIQSDGVLSYWAFYKLGKTIIDGGDDVVDYKWVTLKEAKKYDLIDGI